MVGFIVPSSSLNSFGSICYCLIVLGIHAYASYKDITRYKDAGLRDWPGAGGGPPTEVPLILAMTIMSLLVLPFFCVASFIKIGNLANDGVKLGRDQDEKPAVSSAVEDSGKKNKDVEVDGFRFRQRARYLWKHFCPVAPTLHLLAAFFLLLPEVLLTAAEVKYGYKSADVAWESEIDFLFSVNRALMSQIRSSVNMTLHPNATHFEISATRSTSAGWGDRISISIAFVHFSIALACFLIRYASVFWYTNKVLTLVFAFQLVSMVINSIFGFNSFAALYCVCYSQKRFPNVHLSIGCGVDLTLYLISGLVLLLSTITLFEYGSHYFHEKSKIVERNHTTDTFMKRTVIINSGCQGYIPHSCAMGALVVYAVLKAPLIVDMVHLMRVTSDDLLLSGVICEVCYMVSWLSLWFGLTVKQKWKFRILDYVTLRNVKSLPLDGSVVDLTPQSRPGSMDGGSLNRLKRLSNSNAVSVSHLNSNSQGLNASSEEPCPSDLGTDESDHGHAAMAADIVLDPDGRPMVDSSLLRRQRARRTDGNRVTFHDHSRHSGSFEEEAPSHGSLPRRGSHSSRDKPLDLSQVNVTADIHTSTPQPFSATTSDPSQNNVVMRRYSDNRDNPLSKEYRNSLRSKCGDFYTQKGSSSPTCEDSDYSAAIPPVEPLPTLMSSFRDRVRESSLAASSFKEREKHMLEHYNSYDETPPPPPCPVKSGDHIETTGKRMGHTISDENIVAIDQTQKQPHRNHQQHPHRPSALNHSSYQSDPGPRHSAHSDEVDSNNRANSTLESSDSGLPPLMEDIQLGRIRSGPREEYVVGDKGNVHQHQQQPHHPYAHQPHPQHHYPPPTHPRPLKVLLGGKKMEIGRRDSANYSLTSSQDTSSNESDHGQGLCSQV